MIKLRLDVDYPYPSRKKSFVFTLLNRKVSKDYLQNAKIIARMVNETQREIKAYWFFTPQTIPDQEMFSLMHPDRHEVALHVATNPTAELENLKKITQRKVEYYTIHGTERLLARLMWRRKIWQARVPIPPDFPLTNFWDYKTLELDRECHIHPTEKAVELAEKSIANNEVLHIHPEWLFQRGTRNPRGPYYETLKQILHVDKDLDWLFTRRKGFAKLAWYYDTKEYEHDINLTKEFLKKLTDRNIDIFTFLERPWSFKLPNPPKNWAKIQENLGILHLNTYEEWWQNIGKKTRNMVRKAEKNGVTTAIAEPDSKLAEGIWKIYNETPIRQGRAFPRYGQPLKDVKSHIQSAQNFTFVVAYLEDELVGFIQLVHGKNLTIISQILSMQQHWDKALNNALVAKGIEYCAQNNIHWIMYGRMGNHPSLDTFKQNNNFEKYEINRYYVPLTTKGRLALKLGLHKELKDALPQWLKEPLFPVFAWVSRTKMKLRLRTHRL